MQSMTGYGSAIVEQDGRKVSIEIKAVNHRFLDLNVRMPRVIGFAEAMLQAILKEGMERGHADVYVNYANQREDARQVTLDKGLMSAYWEASKAMALEMDVVNDMTVSTLSRLPDVFVVSPNAEDEEVIQNVLAEATRLALAGLVRMRTEEGEKLRLDLSAKLDTLESLLTQTKEAAPLVAAEYHQRLQTRLAQLIEDGTVDQGRLAAEVAIFADRSAIDEEVVRLQSHIDQARGLFLEERAIGKKLDFLVQEMNREVNTICSKANGLAVVNTGLQMKNEVEKIREQVQNIQ